MLDKMQAQLSKEIFNEISEKEDVPLTQLTSLADNNYETIIMIYAVTDSAANEVKAFSLLEWPTAMFWSQT